MIKPCKLSKGDAIATISPSWGCAGGNRVRWQYNLGVKRLEMLGLRVIAAPNSMKGTSYLDQHPEARAEDLMWAFQNNNVKAIIANIGGNDSERLLPYLDPDVIKNNPKILCGYSDVMTIHLYCHRLGLSTFYGDNLLTTIGEAEMWHHYSKYWFERTLFNSDVIGEIPPSQDWTADPNHHTDPQYKRKYIPNEGYIRVQGSGKVCGRLFGGHGGLIEFDTDSPVYPRKEDFEGSILFYEDIPQFSTPDYYRLFFDTLGENGWLQSLNGIIIGKMQTYNSFEPCAKAVREIVSEKYGLHDMPIMYGLNFGHASPICVLPYGAQAEFDVDKLTFSILESGVK